MFTLQLQMFLTYVNAIQTFPWVKVNIRAMNLTITCGFSHDLMWFPIRLSVVSKIIDKHY